MFFIYPITAFTMDDRNDPKVERELRPGEGLSLSSASAGPSSKPAFRKRGRGKSRFPTWKPAAQPPGMILQERDLRILELLEDYRLLDTRMVKLLIREEFPRNVEDAVKRRLHLMFHNRLVNRPPEQLILRLKHGRHHFVYELTRRGARILAEKRGRDPKGLRAPEKDPSYRYIEHVLEVNRFRVALELALKKRGLPLLRLKRDGEVRFQAEFVLTHKVHARLLRQRLGSRTGIPLVPDLFFGIQVGSREQFYALELDRGTMKLGGVAKKMLGYYKFLARGEALSVDGREIPRFRVLFLSPSEVRVRHLREAAQTLDERGKGYRGLWFTRADQINLEEPTSVLASIWQTPLPGERFSLLD